MIRYCSLLVLTLICFGKQTYAQHEITGAITAGGKSIANAVIVLEPGSYTTTSAKGGGYKFNDVKDGNYTIKIFKTGYDSVIKIVTVTGENIQVNITLSEKTNSLKNVTIRGAREKTLGITRLNDVDGTAIYAGKKNEVVVMKDVVANKATNNTRQLYAKVAGLNIWENDGAGIQLGIGGRGLNPSRVTNFNTRQNGYDISADALGYPESYYTPPADMVEQIEIVRGAASLQYGTQFGGLINFKLNKGVDSQKIQIIAKETVGSWGLFNSTTSVGGTVNKLNYYVFYQRKSGDDWRPNSQFNVNTAYANATLKLTDKFSLTAQYTFMSYLAHQPGGLTDAEFAEDPRQSVRQRNWFKVNWNLAAFIADYNITDHLKFNTRFFALDASRSALGILTYINRADPGGPRDLLVDQYLNWGNESRLLYTYHTKSNPFNLVVGSRFYDGHTNRTQGHGNDGYSGNISDFEFTDPSDPAYSKYQFPNLNTSVFAENIFRFSSKFSVIPGIRYENITTKANGFYNIVNTDLAGNVFFSQKVNESRTNNRSFVIAGIGNSYYQSTGLQLYANISQNYRAINFNDMRVVNPNLQVDSSLKDEKGYSADLGVRGKLSDVFYYDVSAFIIDYDNRIGTILRPDATYNIYRYRTNIGQSRNLGIESFAEVDVWKLIRPGTKTKLSVFCNLSFIDARYIHSLETAYENKKVELVPATILKTGVSFRKNKFAATYQFGYTGQQFTDATNATFTANAINGIIPAYYVMDISAEYTINRMFSVYGSINNLTNNMYYTRRADSYPGPGIIPSDGRSFSISAQVKL